MVEPFGLPMGPKPQAGDYCVHDNQHQINSGHSSGKT